MGFELSNGAKRYYKAIQDTSISGKFKLEFDFYYLCCVLGMVKGRFPELEDGTEVTRTFPVEYQNQHYHIIGLLIDAEIRRTGLDVSNRTNLEKFMLKLVSMDNPTHLSDEGEKYLNRYAEGGYQIILEEIGKMEDYTAFMIKYYDLINRIGGE